MLLLCCVCGVVAAWALMRAGDDLREELAGPWPTRSAATSDAAPNQEGLPGQTFRPGDCVVNDGTESNAKLRKVPCGPDTYEVLRFIPFTSNADMCELVEPDSDTHFAYDSPSNFEDYVLCLRSR